jgi:hypothetical protein
VEGAIVRGLVAQVEGELPFGVTLGNPRRDLWAEAGSLEGNGALGEPIVLRHFLN